MTIKPVVKMGKKQLATPSSAVSEFNSAELDSLIQNMFDTMQKEGGIGIAAPQIGCNKRVIMFGFDESDRYPDKEPIAFTVLVNPLIEILSDEMVDGWEGCLSVPGLRGLVPRYNHIKYSGVDPYGSKIERVVSGFHARVVQHEFDHVEGILFPQRIKDMRYFGFEDEIREWMK